jgi:hypothetical protein
MGRALRFTAHGPNERDLLRVGLCSHALFEPFERSELQATRWRFIRAGNSAYEGKSEASPRALLTRLFPKNMVLNK